MFSVDDLVHKLNTGTVNLTLFNESGESYTAGEVTTFARVGSKAKIRWEASNPFSHVMPLTHAILHRGKSVWTVVAIRPVNNDIECTELELRYS